MIPEISIIIPTFNRADILRQCLNAFREQSVAKELFEIIIVNDNPTQDLRAIVDNGYKFSIKLLNQRHQGPAAAKNLGIKNARGEFITFINDDTFPDKNFVKAHLDLLNKHIGSASAGSIVWHSESPNTALKDALVACGVSGGSHNISPSSDCDFRFFCTGNIALPKKWLDEDIFDEDFKYAAFEDTEIGYRLCQKGLKIFYNAKALVQHLHRYQPEDLIRRQELIGKSTVIFIHKHPELKDGFVKKNYRMLLIISSLLIKIPFLKRIRPSLYFIVLGTYSKYKTFNKEIKKK